MGRTAAAGHPISAPAAGPRAATSRFGITSAAPFRAPGMDGRAASDFVSLKTAGICYKFAMTRRPIYDTRTAAEKAFKAATTKPVEAPPKAPSLPGAKEVVSLRIDRDVLDFFQEEGPGWQERIHAALRKAAGK